MSPSGPPTQLRVLSHLTSLNLSTPAKSRLTRKVTVTGPEDQDVGTFGAMAQPRALLLKSPQVLKTFNFTKSRFTVRRLIPRDL